MSSVPMTILFRVARFDTANQSEIHEPQRLLSMAHLPMHTFGSLGATITI